MAHTTSGRPKDAFGKGMKKPQATVRPEGGKTASPEEAPKKKSCLSSIFGIIIALILLSQVGGCVASCVGDVFDSIDDETSSWFEDSGSERQDGSSSSMNSFSNDEADEAAALASARDALASLDSREKIVDRMVEGRVEKFYKENCLVDQPFVKNPDMTIAQYVNERIQQTGENIKIRRFVRYEMGEGLEKRHDNFAEEVAAQSKKA